MDEDVKEMNIALSRINSLFAGWYEDSQITQARSQVILALASEPGISQKEICTNYLMPKQTVSKEIRLLQEKGYLTMEKDGNDGRARTIHVTEFGQAYFAEVLSPNLAIEAHVKKIMKKSGYEKMIAGLKSYADALETVIRK